MHEVFSAVLATYLEKTGIGPQTESITLLPSKSAFRPRVRPHFHRVRDHDDPAKYIPITTSSLPTSHW
jgi:hypothetical protein